MTSDKTKRPRASNFEGDPHFWVRTPEGTFSLFLDNVVSADVDGEQRRAFTVGAIRRALKVIGEDIGELPDDSLFIMSKENEVKRYLSFYTGKMNIDLLAKTLHINGSEVALPTQEMNLLFFLATHPDEVFSNEELLRNLWPEDYTVAGNPIQTVRQHIRRLRKNITDNGLPGDEVIVNVRGNGYRLVTALRAQE
jgi:DNA-binding response OmpR family regulator